jgi:hypothetical protein
VTGRFKLEGYTTLLSWNLRHQLRNNVAPHLSRTENSSDKALNELFIDCDNDLYNIDNNSNVNDNLPVQEIAAVK